MKTERTCLNFVNRYICADGNYRWLSWNAKSYPESQQIFWAARDITATGWAERAVLTLDLESQVRTGTKQWQNAVAALKQQLAARSIADEALRETHELLRSIITACPHAIIAVDADRNVRLWNPSATKLFGWTEDETLGQPVPFVREQQRKVSDDFNQRALAGEAFTEFAVERTRRDGTKLDLLMSTTSTMTASGTVDGFITVATDLTEFKKLEQQFLRTQRLEGLGKLASGIAHDLNNVLAPISMSLELIRMKSPDASVHQTLDTLATCVQRGAGLIRQIHTFARGVEGERIPLQTRHLLQDTQHVLEQTLAKSITIACNISPDLWVVIADATQIHQVLMNLCVNARDAMPDGGTLTIRAENVTLDERYIQMSKQGRPGTYVMVEIKDNGVGIPADVSGKIFEPFFSTKDVGKGTGLGLSTVAAIVKNHGGFINLYSELGRGTSFKIYLPAVPSEKVAQAAGAEALPFGNGELILIVDDEAAVRDLSKIVLETHGYKVITAANGAEGLATYAEHQKAIRVVVSDTDMPVMNGAAMMSTIQRTDPGARLIAASGLSGEGSPDAQLIEAIFRLPKPYTAAQLLRAVREMIDAP